MVCAFSLSVLKSFVHAKSQFQEKNPVLPIEKLLSLVIPGNAIMLQHQLIVQLHSITSQVVAYRRLKTKGKFKLLTLKVVAVAYKKWSFYKKFQI